MAAIEMEGRRFGRLTVIGLADKRVNKKLHYRCRCDCGNEAVVMGVQLRIGKTRSCGCLSSEMTATRNRKHGAIQKVNGKRRPSPEYTSWQQIKDRCFNRNNIGYANYGGRGITMSERWVTDFTAFLADVGPKPSRSHSIERLDNDRGYEPGNCVWATRSEQSKNRRNVRYYTYQGATLCLADWARELGMRWHTLQARVTRSGWSIDRAVTTPVEAGGAAAKRGSTKKR